MPTNYAIHEIQLQNDALGTPAQTSGGSVMVCTAGSPDRATIYDPDTLLAITGHVTPVRGKIRFATLATVASVDLFGIDGRGRFFVAMGAVPGGLTEIFLTEDTYQTATIPFSIADSSATVEKDTGFDLPANAAVNPLSMGLMVTAIDATETIDVGILSSETAGDADGFLALASVATLGRVGGALAGTDTLGALLKEDTNGSTVLVPKAHLFTGTNGRSISYTLTAGSDTAKGYIIIPYLRLATV